MKLYVYSCIVLPYNSVICLPIIEEKSKMVRLLCFTKAVTIDVISNPLEQR